MEVQVCEGRRPVGVDFWHVHPRDEGFGKGVEEAVFGVVDLRDAQDVVNIGDDGHARGGYQVCSCVAGGRALDLFVQDLDLQRAVSGGKPSIVELYKAVNITFRRCGNRVCDHLTAALGSDEAAAIGARGGRGGERKGDVLIPLLDDIDIGSEVAGLGGFRRGQALDGGAD